jgi:hypothetical protein
LQDETLDVCCGSDSTEGLYHDADADWNPGAQPVVRGFSAGTSNFHRCCFWVVLFLAGAVFSRCCFWEFESCQL